MICLHSYLHFQLCRVRDRLGAYWEIIAPKIRALPVPVGTSPLHCQTSLRLCASLALSNTASNELLGAF